MMVRNPWIKIRRGKPPWNAPVAIDYRAQAHRDPWSMPIEEIDVSNPYIYQDDTLGAGFSRALRRDEPVHFINSPDVRAMLVGRRGMRDIMQVDTVTRDLFAGPTPRWAAFALKDVPLEFRKEKLHRDGSPAAARRASARSSFRRSWQAAESDEDVHDDPANGR